MSEPKLIFDSRRTTCPHCGSSRGYAPAVNIPGAGYCHRCETTDFGDADEAQEVPEEPQALPGLIEDVSYSDLTSRGIRMDVCRKYRYGAATYNGQPVQVASYIDPNNGQVVLQKCRTAGKDFFWLKGRPDADRFKNLFGQSYMKQADQNSGKFKTRVVITEGELDAMAVSQSLGPAWPVVSLPDGASSARKYCAAQLEWLDAHEQVVLFFDMDEAGQKAVEEVLDLFSPGKVHVVRTEDGKDACEVLKTHGQDGLRQLVWDAPRYQPDWIVSGAEAIMEEVRSAALLKGVDYPWAGLNDMLGGIRPGTMTTVAAGSGSGKTLAMRHVALSAMKQGWKVGVLELESGVRDGFLGLASIHLGKFLGQVEEEEMPYDDLEQFAEEFGDRVVFSKAWGSLDSDELISKIRYLAVGQGCKLVILDHISIAVSGLETNDERKAIDILCTKLRLLAEETGVAIMAVSHLRRTPNQTSAEEGGRINGAMLRGSHSLLQLADACWAIERNQLAEDPETRHRPVITVLKDRARGRTGPACVLKFDPESHRLEQTVMPEEGCDFTQFETS